MAFPSALNSHCIWHSCLLWATIRVHIAFPFTLSYYWSASGVSICPELRAHTAFPSALNSEHIQHSHLLWTQSAYSIPICSELRVHIAFLSASSYYQSAYSIPICSKLLSEQMQCFHLLWAIIRAHMAFPSALSYYGAHMAFPSALSYYQSTWHSHLLWATTSVHTVVSREMYTMLPSHEQSIWRDGVTDDEPIVLHCKI